MAEWVRDIYDWHKGYDDDDIKVLKALNNTIDSLYTLLGYGWECIYERLNVMSKYRELIDVVLDDIDLSDVAVNLEAIRTLLIGGKIDYNFLGKHLEENVNEYGFVIPEEEKHLYSRRKETEDERT